ncbi:outer membrane protein assembly factor BamE [Thiotrichales bacterium HSG1]|nr:outer membrane protein assembly factor BamE [Thiotrichales bacterium HSG1]
MPKFHFICIVVIFVSGCSMHLIDIQQGNVVTQEMLDRLELNMPAKKVQFIMGTPLMVDVFHQNRWDYIYTFQGSYKKREQRHISLFFDDNKLLQKIAGDIKIGKSRTSKPLPDVDMEPIL